MTAKNLRYNFVLSSMFIAITMSFMGCDELIDEGEKYLPGYEGPSGTVIVVMENRHWNGTMGSTVREYIEQWQMGLPYPGERMFDVVQTAPHEFSNILKVNRNIIVCHVKDLPQYETPVVNYNPDLWAKDQVVFQIYATGSEGFNEAFHKHGDKIVYTINTKERERLQDRYDIQPNETVRAALAPHNISITVPTDCDVAESQEDFIWIKRSRVRTSGGYEHDVEQDIFIYFYEYLDTNTFTVDYITDKRDSIGKYYVPGEKEGSYMATSFDDTIQMPYGHVLDYNGHYAMEVRGLSKLVNDFRGGPFVSLTIHDPERNRIIVVDGMVHAPQFTKREYLREIEAMIYSLEIL